MPKKEIKSKVCLVGEAAVGKTSLIRRYVLDVFEDIYIATLGAKVTKKVVELDGQESGSWATVSLMLWDIMGEKGFRELLKEAYFHGAQGIIAVSDITRRDTLGELENWIDSVRKVTSDIPVVFVANKVDLVDRAKYGETEVSKMSAEHGSPYVLTSAKTGEGVEEAFKMIARAIVDRLMV